ETCFSLEPQSHAVAAWDCYYRVALDAYVSLPSSSSSKLDTFAHREAFMKTSFFAVLFVLALAFAVAAAPEPSTDKPQYNKAGELLRPENYREWIFLSSGFGMNYSSAPDSHDMFTNVFVPQWAYKQFMKSGAWPDKTTFVVEERMAQSTGSINKHGNFQVDSTGIGVEVKDSALRDKWAYYNFDDNKTAAAN